MEMKNIYHFNWVPSHFREFRVGVGEKPAGWDSGRLCAGRLFQRG